MLRRVAPTAWIRSPYAALRFATIIPLPMPALSPTMTQGNLVSWEKKIGDAVGPGDTLAKIETDKAAVSFDNQGEEGFMARYVIEGGTPDVKVGEVVALLVEDAEDVNSDEVKNWKPDSAAAAPAAAAPAAPAAAEATPAAAAAPSAGSSAPAGSRVMASPLARNLARELGIDVAQVSGTGGSVGRVTKDDVVNASKNPSALKAAAPSGSSAAAPAAPAAPAKTQAPPAPAAGAAYETLELTGMRKTIAARLTQSKNVDVPHYYLTANCNVRNMQSVVKQLNAKGDGKFKISLNDYIIKAVARANLIVPECNTHWHGDHLRRYNTVDVSVAVAIPNGLITPIVKDAHAKGLAEISNEVKALAKLAKEGGLKPEQYQGGTVSVSNLGGFGIDNFTAIINPPQSMILAIGTVRHEAQVAEGDDGEMVATGKVDPMMTFTASFDHRVVDGAVGAVWFKHFKDAIENPLSLLL